MRASDLPPGTVVTICHPAWIPAHTSVITVLGKDAYLTNGATAIKIGPDWTQLLQDQMDVGFARILRS